MEAKYLWPLIGVVLGWLLNRLNDNAKLRSDKKKTIAKLLSKLIQVQSQLQIYRSTTMRSAQPHLDDVEYEDYRRYQAVKHFLKPEYMEADFKNAIDEYSLLYPLSATQLESVLQGLLNIKNICLNESSKNKELYKTLSRTVESAAEAWDAQLEYHIKTVAFQHGAITFLKVKFTNYRLGCKKVSNKINNDIIETNEAVSQVHINRGKNS